MTVFSAGRRAEAIAAKSWLWDRFPSLDAMREAGQSVSLAKLSCSVSLRGCVNGKFLVYTAACGVEPLWAGPQTSLTRGGTG
jgi:hypothetical protein